MVLLFNLDLHISVISDFKNICNSIFPGEIKIDNNSMAFQSIFINQQMNNNYVIRQDNWRTIDENLINLFYQKHKEELKKYDGFIVTHTPIFCLLYEKFNKPIILINSCRYEQPASFKGDLKLWDFINTGLKRLEQKNLLFSVSNNLYDTYYLKQGTDITSKYIPSLCQYHNMQYDLINYKDKKLFLLYSSLKDEQIQRTDVINIKQIKPYSYEQIIQFKAVIHIPYEISTMSMFEHYSMNIPIIVPTKRLLIELYNNNLINFYGNYPVLFNTNIFPEKFNNILDKDWFSKIVEHADYYNEFKYTIYFDNFDDLEKILDKTNFEEISNNIKDFNLKRKLNIYSSWINILDKAFNLNKDSFNSIFDNNNSLYLSKNISKIITCDRYYNFINKLNKEQVQYYKTDFIFREGVWRNNKIINYQYNSKKLVTGHSDEEVSNILCYILRENSNNKLEKIFSINCDSIQDYSYGIPLGITNDCDDSDIHRIYGNLEMMEAINNMSIVKSDKLVYLNINTNTHQSRKEVYGKFNNKSYVKTGTQINTMEGRIKFLIELKSHEYVICPRGNGIDTHRLWETLYMGSIPIVIFTDAHKLFLDLPILFINSWDEINEDFLRAKLVEIKSRKYNYNKLYINYWLNLIISL